MSRSDYDAVAFNVAGSTAALPIEIGADNASYDDSGSEDETRHRRKRRRLDPDAGKQLLSGLMAYGGDTSGSDDESGRHMPGTGDAQADKPSVFDALGDYESDDLQSSEEESGAELALTAAERPQAGGELMRGSAPQRHLVVTVDNQDVHDEVDWGGSDSDM